MNPLPAFEATGEQRFSDAAAFVGTLLTEAAPALQSGELDIVAIARRPGVLSKVALRHRSGSNIVLGADAIAAVRNQLDGERIEILAWAADPQTYVASALGVAPRTPMLLLPAIRHAHVFLGEIDLRGIAGWRNLNVVLASTLTGWRIRLLPIAQTAAWKRLQQACAEGSTLTGTMVEPNLVEIFGLYARLPRVAKDGEVQVRIRRLDADEGRITVTTDRLRANGQLRLPESAATRTRSSSTYRG
jgi:transcription antitermination factor NusA-like protein